MSPSSTIPASRDTAPTSQPPFHYPPEWEGATWGRKGRCLSDPVIDALAVIGGLIWIGAVACIVGKLICIAIDVAVRL